MKRFLSILLAVFMLVAFMPNCAVGAKAANAYVSADATTSNGQVLFFFRFLSFDDVSSTVVEFTYDSEVLQYKSIKKFGDFGMTDTNNNTPGVLRFASANTNVWDVEEDGEYYLRLTFTILDDTVQSTTISGKVTEAIKTDTYTHSVIEGSAAQANVSTIPGVTNFTVTFIDGVTNQVISTQTVEQGKDATLPTAPVHEGYTFTGWSGDGKNITQNTTITAQYLIKTYTVTFVDGVNNAVISQVTVNHGATVDMPTPPAHASYAFSHWDNTGVNITADTTITAKYDIVFQGDVNDDGEVNTGDAVIALQYSVGSIVLSETQMMSADFNHDNDVNTGDAVALLKFCLGVS